MKLQLLNVRTIIPLLCMAGSLTFAADEQADPAVRTWTNAGTGSTIEAKILMVSGKTVRLCTTDKKKNISMPIDKLSEEDQAWIEEHKASIGKPAKDWASTPSGTVATALKGKTYMLKDGKLQAADGKLNAKYFILYFSASWCGPCCANAPHSVKGYHERVESNPLVEVVMCSCDRTLDDAQKWFVKNEMPWPVIMPDTWTAEVKAVAPRGIPTMVLVDKDGKELSRGRDIGTLVDAAQKDAESK